MSLLAERVGVGLIVGGAAVLIAARSQLGPWLSQLWERRQRAPTGRRTPCGNPLPPTLHAVLPAEATVGKRVIIVGDVHGCPAELEALLERVGYSPAHDLLLSVGDLVNKGPDSEQALRLAVEAGVVAVRGNHDDAAYAAFRAWLAGLDIPKPQKHGWVAGLPEHLAAYMGALPYTLQLPAYGAMLVHAGLVPGVPLEEQAVGDMEHMRDVVPAAEAAAADAAAAALAAGERAAALPTGAFDWGAAAVALAAQAGGDGGGGASSGTAQLPPGLRLEGREQQNPLGRAWAAVWLGRLPSHDGPLHVFFGHDAARRLQLHPAATGLDTGCVYGGQLTAAVLPPLDAAGQPLLDRLSLPPGAREVRLCSGLPAFLVQVQAAETYSHKFEQPAQQLKAQRQAEAKAHMRRALEAAPAAAAEIELGRGAGGRAAAEEPGKGAAEKKRE